MIVRINYKNIPENEREKLFPFLAYNSLIKSNNHIGIVRKKMAIAFEFAFRETFSCRLVLRYLNEEANKDFENKFNLLNDQLLKNKKREIALKCELGKFEKNITQLESEYSSSMMKRMNVHKNINGKF